MSYILEALKKAETERLAAAAHASPLPPGFASAGPVGAAPDMRRWRWLAVALAAAVAGGAAWLAMRDEAPQAASVIAAAPLPPTVAVPADPTVAAVSATPPRAEPPAAPAQEKPVEQKPRKEKPVSEKPAKKKTEKKPQAPDDAAPLAGAEKETAATPVATLHDLPAQIRSEIPPLQIAGYIYSASRANRSVLINKRLLREGDEITPGLRLEEMARDGMILNYKGYRYRASY